MTTHSLKIWPAFYRDVISGLKRFEVRKVDDHVFQVGDILHLREWDPSTGEYTGQQVDRVVTYVVSLSGIGVIGYVGMSIEPVVDQVLKVAEQFLSNFTEVAARTV